MDLLSDDLQWILVEKPQEIDLGVGDDGKKVKTVITLRRFITRTPKMDGVHHEVAVAVVVGEEDKAQIVVDGAMVTTTKANEIYKKLEEKHEAGELNMLFDL